jgi:hypothetical protein
MSRANEDRFSADDVLDPSADEQAPQDSAQAAENIGFAALYLAKRARAAGLTMIGDLLETVALEAGAQAAATRRPTEGFEN